MANEPEGMNLTQTEACHLARLLVARLAKDSDWLLWENLPELGEFAFERLEIACRKEAQRLWDDSKDYDKANGVDAEWLAERAM